MAKVSHTMMMMMVMRMIPHHYAMKHTHTNSHCFGWWYSKVESLTANSITFRNDQYSPESRWATVTIPWKAESIKPDPEGGQVGGLRKVDDDEVMVWKGRLPVAPVF